MFVNPRPDAVKLYNFSIVCGRLKNNNNYSNNNSNNNNNNNNNNKQESEDNERVGESQTRHC